MEPSEIRTEGSVAVETPDQRNAGQQVVRLPHSGVGISSFVLSMVSFTAFVAFFVAAIIDRLGRENGAPRGAAFVAVVITLLLSMGSALVGVGLGVAGVAAPNRKRLFGTLGLIFNLLVILLFVGLIMLGVRHSTSTIHQA